MRDPGNEVEPVRADVASSLNIVITFLLISVHLESCIHTRKGY